MKYLTSSLTIFLAVASSVQVGAKSKPQSKPLKFGFLAFPDFEGLDIYGPLELLNIVAILTPNTTLSIVAETMDPVPAQVGNPIHGAVAWVKPTYTFDQNPALDVLIVPGGPGSQVAYNDTKVINYVKRTYPKLKYMLSTCTGAQLLAKAGILDGKKATTSKYAWNETVASGPTVEWVPCARWVVDGNIWSSSGVTAGMDMTYAFISQVLGNTTLADLAVNVLEYEPHKDPSWDPFCKIWNATTV